MNGRLDMRCEQGSALILGIVLIPVLVILGSFAVDTANWFLHKRQMQIKADAAALAGAGELADAIEAGTGCPDVAGAVNEYAKLRNPHVHGGASGEAEASTSERLNADPCEGAVDVTVEERQIRRLFGIGPLDSIEARARVELQQTSIQDGVFPLGIAMDPTTVSANGVRMTDTRTVDTAGRKVFRVTLPGVTISDRYSVDVRLGSAAAVTNVAMVRGYAPPSSTGNQFAKAGDVQLERNLQSCSADSFSRPYYFSSNTPCRVGISAEIDFNDTVPAPKVADQRVFAVVDGTRYPLQLVAGRWTRPQLDLPIAAGAGTVPIQIHVDQIDGKVQGTSGPVRNCSNSNGANHACTGEIETLPLLRPYSSANDTIGRVEVGSPTYAGGVYGQMGLVSVPRGTVTDLTVTVALTSNLSLSSGVRTLRFTGSNQTGGVVCAGTNGNWANLFRTGCPTPYQLDRDDSCASIPSPPDCLDPRTGGAPSPATGLVPRILGADGICQDATEGNDSPGRAGDPRLIPLALVPYGSFSGSGGSQASFAPVKGFAWFYVTGWTDNLGNKSPCPSDEFAPGTTTAHKDYVFGRFVKRVDDLGSGGTGGTTLCRATDIYGCVAVMTH